MTSDMQKSHAAAEGSDRYLYRQVGRERLETYSVMMRSAHSTRPTKTAGLPNLKSHCVTSDSVTPRARLQAPQAKTGILSAIILARRSHHADAKGGR